MAPRALVFGALLVCGCATATHSGNGPDASTHRDGSGPPPIDTPAGPDAAISITLNETSDTTVAAGRSVACADTNSASPTYGNTYDNTWYREFQLSDFPAISGGLHISSLMFGVESCKAAGTITVAISKYTGPIGGATLNLSQTSMIAMATASPTDSTTGQQITVSISADIPAGDKFVVSVAAPNVLNSGYFYIGSTAAAETHPAYQSSTACSITTPEATSTVGATGHVVLTVSGTH